MGETLPAWATRKPYIEVRCSECNDEFEGFEGGALLFETLDKARESFEDLEWVEDGDRLLCAHCDAKRWCEQNGHAWRRYDGARPDGTERTVWGCTLCSETTRDEPAAVTR